MPGSIFVSNIPKAAPSDEVERFLKTFFPTATLVVVPRGTTVSSHKGCAYTHFSDAAEAVKALKELEGPLELHGAVLRTRTAHTEPAVCTSSNSDASARLDMSLYEGAPLPPRCLPLSHARCAYRLRRSRSPPEGTNLREEAGNKKGEEVDDMAEGSVVLTLPARSVVSKGAHEGGSDRNKEMVEVVYFGSAAAREAAVVRWQDSRVPFARCGPLSLVELLSIPLSETPRAGVDAETKMNQGDNPEKRHKVEEGLEERMKSWAARGLTPLRPVEALDAVREFLDGQGRIAVRDADGAVAVLKVPTYVASLDE